MHVVRFFFSSMQLNACMHVKKILKIMLCSVSTLLLILTSIAWDSYYYYYFEIRR